VSDPQVQLDAFEESPDHDTVFRLAPGSEHSGNSERKVNLRESVKKTDFPSGTAVEIGLRFPCRKKNDVGSRKARRVWRDFDGRAKDVARESLAEPADATDVDFRMGS
jgi:hypothetical protein